MKKPWSVSNVPVPNVPNTVTPRAMSRLAKAVVLFVSLIGLGTWGGNAMAAIKTSVAAGGTWSTAATWNPVGVPATGDTVIIAGPGLVTITGNVTQTAVGSVTVNSGASLSTTGGTTIFGALTIANTGTATTSRVLRVLGATNITGTINFQTTARANVFTGDVTLNGGAVWNEAIAITPTFSGNFTNNATTFTASTGAHTFNGATKILSGATTTSIPRATFTGNYTNSGTLTSATLLTVTGVAIRLTNNGIITATTALSGTGGVTQGATGVLNIGAASAIITLTAIAAGNVVNYTGGAAQTVKATTYDTLNFSGAGVKTNSGIVTVNTALTGTAMTNAAAGTLNIGGTSTITTLTATAVGNIVNYTGAAQTVKVTSYSNLNVTGTATISGTVTAAASLGGIGTLTNDATGILNIGGTSLITTLNASTAGNIVNYTGAGAQTINPTTYATLNFSGVGVKTNSGIVTVNTALTGTAMTNAATGTLNIGGTSTITTLTATAAGNIVNYTGAAQTIKATTYDTLNVTGTATNSGTVTAATALGGVGTLTNDATGILNIGGTSLITTLTATTVGNIVNYTGAGAQTINPTTYATLNFSGAGVKTNSGVVTVNTALTGTAMTNAATGTLNIGGTSTITTLTAAAAGNIVNYTGAGQTVKATTYHHLGLGGSGAKAVGATAINGDFTLSGSATTAPTGALTVGGNFTIGVGTTFTAGALAHSVGGNWNNSGMFTAGTSTITLNGAVPQTIGGTSNTTFNNLTVNNANGVILNSGPTVSGTLALTAGVVTAGSHTLRSSANCPASITVGTGYVHGSVELTFPAGNVTCRFPVGSGSVYAPIDLTTPVGSAGGKMTGTTTGNEHVDVANSSIDSSKDVNRFWTLSGDTIGAGSYVATFNFVTGDVDIGANPLGFVLGRYAGAWTAPASPTPSALAITASLAGPIVGITDFVAGEAGFVCSVPAGSPVGTTCVCDNFNRVSLNPSTIYGGSWGVSTNSGSFGVPRIINNRLRLTDNTPSVSTAATSPGTFPARGNWISVEFKHYAYGSNTARTGTISTTAGATAVTGGGTLFMTELANGQHLYTATGVYIGTISSITSNTALALAAGAAATHTSIVYGSTGAGADGIALTLSDSTITAVPGAFGGSLGYAQKCQNGVAGCANDCNVAGGCPGFTAGWVGIGLDEYGNFSNNTEGRVGVATPPPTAPGLTLDSVGVRGSGSGQIGYPYLGGTGTLTPGIDNATSAAAAPGDAYRLMVDARGYTYHPTLNPGGVRSALVTVERDTSGTGTSYTPLFTSFDAYVANPSQADVPENWQLSFTGSTGGANNIHEMLGLKICAQTYVPPAGYRIQVDNLTPTTCPSDPQPTVTISPLNTNGQVITTYTNTVTLSATLSGGGVSSATWVPQGTNQGTWDSVNKRYTFAAGDNGVAKFYLSDLVPQDVYITVTEYTAPGTLTSTLGAPVQFSSGAASFVVSTPAPDTLGDGVVAGRPHLMRITRNKATCGGGTDTTGYEGARALDGWYNPATGEHPTGANAPQICLAVAGACLPAYGSCQTLSIAPPVVDSGNHNLSLTFLNGVANFCLITSDVGKYSLGLRDDTVATGTPAVTGTSTTLTARPFAVVVSKVRYPTLLPPPNEWFDNPAASGSGGAVFRTAGSSFEATVGGYLWTSNGTTNQGRGDTGGDGVPDALATSTELTAGGIAPHYADTVTLAAGAPYTPVPAIGPPAFVAGALSNGGVSVTTGGTATVSTLSYDEVGSFTLMATPAVSYLNSGVDLGPRVAIFSIPSSSSQNKWVGRFVPDHFAVSGPTITAGCSTGTAFTYFSQDGFTTNFTLTAQAAGNATTTNYAGDWAKLPLTVWGAAPASAGSPGFGFSAATLPGGSTLATSDTTAPTGTWSGGNATVSAKHKISRPTALTGPTTVTVSTLPVDSDGVTLPSATALGTPLLRFGRLRLINAYGSELLPLRIEGRAEHWDGNRWTLNADDACTSIAAGNVTAAGGIAANTCFLTNPPPTNPINTSCLAQSPSTSFLDGKATWVVFDRIVPQVGFTDLTITVPGWLKGDWSSAGTGYDENPVARIKLGSPKAPYIYLRERY